ncbi:MAG: hypothetical protein CFE44_01650 [Burkholderiales bacterium PBB4]|nr:MAG: hypothetical protein CFE44_01650 [Burkholderiales bacterium PBB4]
MDRSFESEKQSAICFGGIEQREIGSITRAEIDQIPPTILITSVPEVECRVEVKGSTFEIEGLTSEVTGGQASEIVRAAKNLLSEILKVKVSLIKSATKLLGREECSNITLVHTLYLPPHTREQVREPELRSAFGRFVQLIGPERNQAQEVKLADSKVADLVEEAAKQFKKLSGGKAVPSKMEIESPLWPERVTLPQLIGDPPAEMCTEVKFQVSGAFRGYFIDGRYTDFLKDCKLDRKPLRLSFDEERYYKRIKKLSTRAFSVVTIRYTEHRVGNRVDRLELTEIIGVTDDFFSTED